MTVTRTQALALRPDLLQDPGKGKDVPCLAYALH